MMADAATIDVEKVNVAEILEREDVKAQEKELLSAFEANPEAAKVLDAVKTAEDAYELIKNALKITLKDFKVLFEKTVDYFKSDKTALDDDTLECVAGGSSWWDKYKKVIVLGSLVATGVVLGVVVGAVTFGLGAAVVGGVTGFFSASAIGGFVASHM